mmetsp:Transcript_47442/g.131905  ORF Transcript_47442/g.131905 Transcript_47442/m.131905 type:complete len:253 (-) Transcript_47442:858-1616(-)
MPSPRAVVRHADRPRGQVADDGQAVRVATQEVQPPARAEVQGVTKGPALDAEGDVGRAVCTHRDDLDRRLRRARLGCLRNCQKTSCVAIHVLLLHDGQAGRPQLHAEDVLGALVRTVEVFVRPDLHVLALLLLLVDHGNPAAVVGRCHEAATAHELYLAHQLRACSVEAPAVDLAVAEPAEQHLRPLAPGQGHARWQEVAPLTTCVGADLHGEFQGLLVLEVAAGPDDGHVLHGLGLPRLSIGFAEADSDGA